MIVERNLDHVMVKNINGGLIQNTKTNEAYYLDENSFKFVESISLGKINVSEITYDGLTADEIKRFIDTLVEYGIFNKIADV